MSSRVEQVPSALIIRTWGLSPSASEIEETTPISM
jgi:hypothetical protein